jgi:hypothetical protein
MASVDLDQTPDGSNEQIFDGYQQTGEPKSIGFLDLDQSV